MRNKPELTSNSSKFNLRKIFGDEAPLFLIIKRIWY